MLLAITKTSMIFSITFSGKVDMLIAHNSDYSNVVSESVVYDDILKLHR